MGSKLSHYLQTLLPICPLEKRTSVNKCFIVQAGAEISRQYQNKLLVKKLTCSAILPHELLSLDALLINTFSVLTISHSDFSTSYIDLNGC